VPDEPDTSPATPARNGRILLVDDEPEFTELMGTLLGEGLGATIHAFNDPRAAVDAIERIMPDFVVSDLLMPQLSGLEMVRAIAQLKPGLKSVLVTGNAVDPQDLQAQGGANVVAVLSKPVSWREIAAVVKQHTAPSAPAPTG
jgi:CheY-like chemotaxis protein